MTLLRPLDEDKLRALYDWLHCMGMPVNRYLHREYSDSVLVAKLLKKLYPRFVDIHNYQPRLNHSSKMTNWQTLNYKVLSRIGLALTNEQTDILAKGTYGYVERLLWAIMNLKSSKPMRSKYSKREGSAAVSCVDLSVTKRIEKIGDMCKPAIKDTIKEIRDKVVALENLLKERDSDLKTLVNRVNHYEIDNKALKKALRIPIPRRIVKKGSSCQGVRFSPSTKSGKVF